MGPVAAEGTADVEARVWARAPAGTREFLLRGLAPGDLRTLLLAVARERAAAVRPADVLHRWRQDRFVRPAGTDPRALARVEARMWELLPAAFAGVELSPVVPLGTSSALAPIGQGRVVSTTRLGEVLSDSTNALAVEAAHRRRPQPPTAAVHLAASHRQLRAQVFGPGAGAHFRLFALVSSTRDAGSRRTEAQLLVEHVRYWQRVLADLLPAGTAQVRFTVFDDPALAERVEDAVLPAVGPGAGGAAAAVPLLAEPGRERGRGYYAGAAIRLTARGADGEVELGDGGGTTWTAQLLGDAKERCLVSCLATERLTDLVTAAGG
ncbi:hypothetical protein [Kineococcus glutinatus]|uniref:Condensation domain-containing protein n=1 Tax=Kineococcus glutinatus TaxID=1070872 RepID=A0ABP9HZZ3_9ACTN